MKTRQLPDCDWLDWPDLQLGEWCWYNRIGIPHAGIALCTPNGITAAWPEHRDTLHPIKARWEITGDGDTITCFPSLWLNQGQGAPREWHGWLKNGELTPA